MYLCIFELSGVESKYLPVQIQKKRQFNNFLLDFYIQTYIFWHLFFHNVFLAHYNQLIN